MKKRIWELDMLRGGNLLLMILIHFVYDITSLFPLVISGICVTLGKHSIRRGLTVLGGGMIITAVTVVLSLTPLCDSSIIIYFGILHCLGCCMLLWPVFRKCPGWLLILLGFLLVLLGKYLDTLTVNTFWFVPLGVVPPRFCSSDYFPLVHHLGLFLCGAGAGRYLYPTAATRFPKVRQDNPLLRFLGLCGRRSLLIYLLHQPILAAIAAGLYGLFGS